MFAFRAENSGAQILDVHRDGDGGDAGLVIGVYRRGSPEPPVRIRDSVVVYNHLVLCQ